MLKKLKRIEVEAKLKSLGLIVFTPAEFRRVFNVSQNTASAFISSNLASGLFIKLRNNFYILGDSSPSHFFVANKLYQPSYISLETALSYYGVIPEVVYTTTSITTKTPREFKTPMGNFSYQHIRQNVFTGYGMQKIGRDNVLIADAEKALADYLYFVDLKKVSLNDRLKLGKINKSSLIRYVKLFQRANMLNLINTIYVEYRKPRKIY